MPRTGLSPPAGTEPMNPLSLSALRTVALRAVVACAVLAFGGPVLRAQVTANDDFYFGTEGFPVFLQVLNNDAGPIDSLTLEVVTPPANATATVDAVNTRILFTPIGDANGFDEFRYAIGDGVNPPDTAVVTMLVYPVNDPPVIADDADSTLEGANLFVFVLANDSDDLDPLGNIDPFTIAITVPPAHGTATPTGGALGRVLYVPAPGFTGVDSFRYRVCDDGNPLPAICGEAWALVWVLERVQAGPDATICLGDSVRLTASGPGNYTWSPATGLSCTECPSPWAAPGSTTTYTVSSDAVPGGPPNTDVLTVTVNLPGSATANDDAYALAEDGSRAFAALANDVPSDSFDVVLVRGTANGALVFGADGSGTYTPAADYSGTDTAVYAICPRGCPAPCDTARIVFSVSPVNDPPLAVDDAVVTDEDVAVAFRPLLNDTDADGGIDTTSIIGLAGPFHGSVTVDPVTGTVTYTPDPDFFGTDSLRYRVCDLGTPLPAQCDEAVVLITVLPVPDPPVAVDDALTVPEDGSGDVDVLANDTDADGSLGTVTVTIGTPPANGTASPNPDGSVTYTPDPDYFGADAFTYVVCDALGACDSATVAVTVTPVNDPPLAADDVAVTDEDTPVTVDVAANDTDVDGTPDPGTVSVIGTPDHGTATAGPGGITYTPDPDFFGTDSVAYAICDDGFPLPAACDTAWLIVLVSPVNDPISAADDAFSVFEDSVGLFAVLANDADMDGVPDPASVFVLTPPANGTATVDPATGLVTYTPDPDYYGPDAFTYRVCDNGVPPACDSASVAITVLPVNDPPVAVDDAAATAEDVPVTANVLANDTDVDGSPTTVSLDTPPLHGSAVVNPDGSVTYTPGADFSGTDSLAYTVCDDGFPLPAACATAWLVITVNPVNDAPVAVDDALTLPEDGSAGVAVLANDSDPDGPVSPAGLSIATAPAHGTLTPGPGGVVTYTPDPDYYGADSFAYALCDGAGACDTAWVAITVTPVNDPPVAVTDNAFTPEDVAVTLDLPANDTDVDGTPDPATVSVLTPPASGTVTVDPITGQATYTPAPGTSGVDSFAYLICDDGFPLPAACDTGWAFVAVAAVNDPISAADDAFPVLEDTPAGLDVLANDTDPDGGPDPASLMIGTPPANGTATVDPLTGLVTYTPDPDYYGPDAFTYIVCDDGVPPTCDTATVTLTVQPVNDPPVALDDTVVTAEDTPQAFFPLANDTDVDGTPDAATLVILTGPSAGTATVDPLSGTITYTPAPGFDGADSLAYAVCDDGFPLPPACDTAWVWITVFDVPPFNAQPVAGDDAFILWEDSAAVLDVLANDADPDGSLLPATLTILLPPAHGTATPDPLTGAVAWAPELHYWGPDSFTYRICDDGFGPGCDTAIVRLDLQPVNDPPVADRDTMPTLEGVPVNIDVLTGDTDVDGSPDPATVQVVTPPANGTATVLAGPGSVIYTPAPGFFGVDSFAYAVCDDGFPLPAACDTAWVLVLVTEIPNVPPVAADDALTLWEDSTGTLAPLANDADADGGLDTASLAVITPPANGTAAFGPSGQLTYTPAPDYYGADSLAYAVCDVHLPPACDTAWIRLDVLPVNDPPVAGDDGVATPLDVAVGIPILANDTDVDGSPDPGSVSLVQPPAHGTVTWAPGSGTLTYTPDPGFTGIDTLRYAVCDDGFPLPAACDTAWVLVAVGTGALPNLPPLAAGDTLVVWEDSTATWPVLANDTDPEGHLDSASAVLLGSPLHGTASLAGGLLTYSPAPDYWGADSVAYAVCDLDIPVQCDTAWILIGVVPVNDPPVAADDTASSVLGAPAVASVLDNDTDVDGSPDPATVQVITPPANGTATVDPLTGAITYTPAPGFSGLDSLAYAVCDDGFPLPPACDSAWLVVTVTADPPGNDPPVALDDAFAVWEDSVALLDVLANDVDPEGALDTASLVVLIPPVHGTAFPLDGRLRYLGDLHFNGPDSLAYAVFDAEGLGDSAWVRLDVRPVADPPSAEDDALAGSMDLPLAWNPLANDSDPDGDLDSASVTVTWPPLNGSLDGSAGGWTYLPDEGWCGTDSFQYAVADTSGLTDTAWVSVFVACDSFWAADDAVLTGLEAPVDIPVVANDDPRADAACLQITVLPENGTAEILQPGTIRYTPAPGFWGTDTMVYRVCDSTGLLSDEARVVVTVRYDRLTIPDGFSPNGDGRNDRFVILGLDEHPDHELVIVNRWGNELFRAAPYAGDWDGTRRGKPLPEATYFFILTLDRNDPSAPLTGPVTIRR